MLFGVSSSRQAETKAIKKGKVMIKLAENENPVAKAAAMAVPVPVNNDMQELLSFLATHPGKQFNFAANKKKISKKKNHLSEKEAKVLSSVGSALSSFKMQSQQVINIQARHEYPILPYAPLRWRAENMLPILAPFRLNNPVFSGKYFKRENGNTSWFTDINIDLPKEMMNCYRDGINIGHSKFAGENFKFTTFFDGLIPVQLIPIIKEAKPLFEDIFIIAEAGQYQIEKVPAPKPIPINDDPLVVGYYDGQIYLIAAFDLSPMEEAFVETAGEGGFTKLERSQDNIMLHQLAGYLEL